MSNHNKFSNPSELHDAWADMTDAGYGGVGQEAPATPSKASSESKSNTKEARAEVAGVPSRDELLGGFDAKRQQFQDELDQLEAVPGFKRNYEEKVEIEGIKDDIEALSTEWKYYGGEEIDAAQAQVDALNFKSNADDHIRAKTALRDAKDAFYEKFKKEFADTEAESEARERTINETPVDLSGVLGKETDPTKPSPADHEAAAKKAAAAESEAAKDDKEEEKSKDEEPEKLPALELTPDEMEEYQAIRDKYAELSAKGRNSYLGGFLKNNGFVSKYLKKIPGVAAMADKLNEKIDNELNQARVEYEDMLAKLQDKLAKQYEAVGIDAKDIHGAQVTAAIGVEAGFEQRVVKMRQEMSKSTNGFVNWWTRQQGVKGKLIKGAVIAGGGVALGVAGALLGSGLAGVAAATAAGGAVGHHVKNRRANAVVDKETGHTVAESQSVEDFDYKHKRAEEVRRRGATESEGSGVKGSEFTSATETRTAEEKRKNRKRTLGAAVVAKSGAVAGAGAFNFFSGLGGSEVSAVAPDSQGTVPGPEQTLPVEKPSGAEFVSVPDGTGGERLMETLGIDKETWYLHENSFREAFPDLTYPMADGHIGLLDTSAGDISQYPTAVRDWWNAKL